MTKISLGISKKKKHFLRQDTTSLTSDGLIERLNASIQETKNKINNQKEVLRRIDINVEEMNKLTS